MPKVEFLIDLDKIIFSGVWSILREDWYKKEGYEIVYPKISEELKQEIKKSEELIQKEKFVPSSEIKKIIEKELSEMNLEEIRKKIEKNWKPIEEKFFELAPDIVGKQWHHEKYTCYLTPYGPGGSYDWQNYQYLITKVNEKTTNKNHTVIHELIHCLIQEEIKNNNINHWTKERIVDLYLAKTLLKELLPNELWIQKKNALNSVDGIFEKTTNIYEIMKELKK